MKNEAGGHSFRIQGKSSMYTCFICYSLALFIFLCFTIHMKVIYVHGLKHT